MPPPASGKRQVARLGVFILMLAISAAVAGCFSDDRSDSSEKSSPGAGSAAWKGLAWSLRASDGSTLTPEAFRGNATAVFFMATWCTTCAATSPGLKSAVDSVPRARALSLSIEGSGDTDGALERWKREKGHAWPHARDTAGLTRAFGIEIQSYVVVLDGEGREAWRAYAPSREAVAKALADASGA